MKMRRVGFGIVNAVAACLLASHGWAECITASQWVEGVKERSVGVTVSIVFDLENTEAKAAVRRLNAMPPETAIVADHIVVLMAQNNVTRLMMDDAMVGFFNLGCMVAKMRPNAAAVSTWINEPGEGV